MSRHLAFSGHLSAAVPSGPMGRGRPSPATPGPAACAAASESLLACPLRSASATISSSRSAMGSPPATIIRSDEPPNSICPAPAPAPPPPSAGSAGSAGGGREAAMLTVTQSVTE